MKTFQITILLVLLSISAISQSSKIAVHHNGSASFHPTFDAAITAALAGDTVYIPGGQFDIGDYSISKKLVIVGVGYHPDSCATTGISILNGTLRFKDYADNGFLTGVQITNYLFFGTDANDQQVDNFTVKRCQISAAFLSFDGYTQTPSKGFVFKENIITSLLGGYAHNCLFDKNIIGTPNYFSNTAYFHNNLFLDKGSLGYSITSCYFQNNIFMCNSIDPSISSCIFHNNLFQANITFPVGTNIGRNNIVDQPETVTFEYKDADTYSTTQNYHLQAGSPGKNAGTDGTDIGIYGTANPFKDGGLPAYPHFRLKNIPDQPDGNGSIRFRIDVVPQN